MFNTIGSAQRLLLRLACPLMGLLVAAASLQAQDSLLPAPTKKTVQTTETLTLPPGQFPESSDIAELRARLGIGIGEGLKGVVGNTDPDQLFQESLKKLEAQQGRAITGLLPAGPTRPLKLSRKPTKSVAQAVLRASAKKLEGLAAELEQVQFYDKADQLREIAAKYWLQARSMD